ncbi:MAG: hypothetical protein ABIN67_17390 [Ferruginibacter sp.]
MRSQRLSLFLVIISVCAGFFIKAQTPAATQVIDSITINYNNCKDCSATFLLNSLKEKDDWKIITGPKIKDMEYPLQPYYSKPFPSWEMDRFVGDSSYFKDCDWMLLPEKRKVVNTVSRLPIVFVKEFTTVAPAKLKVFIRMLYDNMAYIYIDSTRIPLNHPNPDVNRFIKEIRPELSSFVSIPATFNYSYNASYYAGNFFNLTLPKGNHIIKIELFNNANELGCVIKGMMIAANEEKIFTSKPTVDEELERVGILVYRNDKAYPENHFSDSLFYALMHTVKGGYWIDNLLAADRDLISNDTLYIKKGEKINITPAYVTEFRNGNKDTAAVWGTLKKITRANTPKKQWDKNFSFIAVTPGFYSLEITCESPADAVRKAPDLVAKYTRIIKVK